MFFTFLHLYYHHSVTPATFIQILAQLSNRAPTIHPFLPCVCFHLEVNVIFYNCKYDYIIP